ncbi:CPBP family intramembrane glutamic endopeptidase [Geofilum rhodophaeum]|uniref:CPBP family intramembrane glutamic endopeptidase n=1 Tax=Geofilum rhodophaeum TaxID=1965019 RepID=UPI000B5267DD|nr:type II CAAX endopeptidase family protein [Geofilum rhodophaeum]
MSNAPFKNSHPLLQLLILLLLMPVSVFVVSLLGMLLLLPFGGTTLWEAWMQGQPSLPQLKYLQVLQSVGLFIVPALLAARLFSDSLRTGLFFKRPSVPGLLLSICLIIAAQPLVLWLASEALQPTLPEGLRGLSEWMHQSEETVNKTLYRFLDTRGTMPLLLNLLMMVVLPALGEEMLFRGSLQPMLQRWLGRPHTAIWLTALLFSAMHLQFLTFFPRLFLGALLGYLLLYGKSLWYPVAGHFINNLLALFLFYYYRFSQPDVNPLSMEQSAPALWLLLLSGVLTGGILMLLKKNQSRAVPPATSSFSEGR